jgi:hypothetical protein
MRVKNKDMFWSPFKKRTIQDQATGSNQCNTWNIQQAWIKDTADETNQSQQPSKQRALANSNPPALAPYKKIPLNPTNQ